MSTLEAVQRFVVPVDLATETDFQLRVAGEEGAERFVLWSGSLEGSTFLIETMHVPRQRAYRLPAGLMVRVEGDELHRLNRWLFENNQELGVQVHSHPTDAFHSELDDSFPIVTVRGALSIVVPDFAALGIRGPGVAGYRLSKAGWMELSPAEMTGLVVYER